MKFIDISNIINYLTKPSDPNTSVLFFIFQEVKYKIVLIGVPYVNYETITSIFLCKLFFNILPKKYFLEFPRNSKLKIFFGCVIVDAN